jgi:hypothetical protein
MRARGEGMRLTYNGGGAKADWQALGGSGIGRDGGEKPNRAACCTLLTAGLIAFTIIWRSMSQL